MTAIIFYQTPGCCMPRSALTIIGNAGIELRAIKHLKTPPARTLSIPSIESFGLTPRQPLPVFANAKPIRPWRGDNSA